MSLTFINNRFSHHFQLGRFKLAMLFIVAFVVISPQVSALQFSGKAPGISHATIQDKDQSFTLENDVISITWKISNNQIYLDSITDKLTKTQLKQQESPAFSLSATTTKSPINQWKIISPPKIISIKALPKSSSKGKCIPGKGIRATLYNADTGLTVNWMAELRNGSNYILTRIAISGKKDITLNRVALLNHLTAPGVKQVGSNSLGAPAIAGHFFFGTQVPFFKNDIQKDKLTQAFRANLPIKKGVTPQFSQVIGVFTPQHLRRDFLYYSDRERARSYAPFLHYNCWFDLERKVSETGMLDRINAIHKELGEKRGVKVVSYVVDDGYDDYSKGFWVFNTKKFPHGFKPLAKRLAKIDSHLGVWLSPAGGYVGTQERINQAKKLGIPGLNLSYPEYYKWFLNRHIAFIKNAKINYFKWDKLGGGVSGHFMALMDIAKKLRKINPNLFINTTVGTWQSPFWLNQVDCTWRGGSDMGFKGKGNNREKWMTYRDGVTYDVIAKSGFIYPLNAIMNHGVIYANGHPFPRKTLADKENFKSEVRSYFGGGYALQELYLTPSILSDKDWDAIADSAKWAKQHADILIDSHFIGGNPNKLEVYGFAAWNDNQGTLTLRNPNDKKQTISLDVQTIFELPNGAAKNYTFTTPYSDQRIKKLEAQAGKPLLIELQPFEILTFNASAKK